MGQIMSSTGDTSSARNLVSGLQRKKKRFRRGAARSITIRQDVHATKQMAAACAAMGNWRNRSIPFIGTPSQTLNSADLTEHGMSIKVYSLAALGRRELQRAGSRPSPIISVSC